MTVIPVNSDPLLQTLHNKTYSTIYACAGCPPPSPPRREAQYYM